VRLHDLVEPVYVADRDSGRAVPGEKARRLAGGVPFVRGQPPSMRAIEDWVVPIRRASSVWVSPARVRSV
jgi:hypothetical protein